MANFAPKRTDYDQGDRRWARDLLGLITTDVSLDQALFPTGTYPLGSVVKSGTFLGRVTATKRVGPYDPAATDGRQKTIGILLNDWKVEAGLHLLAAASGGGPVDRRYLPSAPTATIEGHLPSVTWIN